MTSDDTKLVYTFFAPNYLYFTWLRGNRSEMVGKRSRRLFLKGPRGILGVSWGPNSVQLYDMSNSKYLRSELKAGRTL